MEHENEAGAKDARWLETVLDSVTYCFCNVCCHSPLFGPCQSCRCQNKGNAKQEEKA